MKQAEMSRYLKMITLGIGVVFLICVAWFIPSVLREMVVENSGMTIFRVVVGLIWITSVPCFLCLWKFWGVCVRIGKDESFSKENADALKSMSYYMLTDSILYVIIFAVACIGRWYVPYGMILLFGLLIILAVCISLTVLCASLSHLVYKASLLQDEQDLTI